MFVSLVDLCPYSKTFVLKKNYIIFNEFNDYYANNLFFRINNSTLQRKIIELRPNLFEFSWKFNSFSFLANCFWRQSSLGTQIISKIPLRTWGSSSDQGIRLLLPEGWSKKNLTGGYLNIYLRNISGSRLFPTIFFQEIGWLTENLGSIL